jgi:pilus assembly protein CpaB
MQARRLILIVALLLILLTLGGFAVLWWIAQQQTTPPPTTIEGTPPPQGNGVVEVTATPAEVTDIVFAVQPLNRGDVIPAEALQLRPWPNQYLPQTAITDINQVVGQKARARYSIPRDTPLFTTMIVTDALQVSPFGSDAAARIPPGFTAISIPYNPRNGVAQGIKDGDYVNVIVSWALVDIDQEFQSVLPNLTAGVIPPGSSTDLSTTNAVNTLTGIVVGTGPNLNPEGRGSTEPTLNQPLYLVPQEPQRSRLVTQGIIQNALVLRLGQFGKDAPEIAPPPTPTPSDPSATAPPPPPPTPTPPPPDIITVVVSPQEALVLDYVSRLAERFPNSVKFTFTLRSAGDTNLAETQSVTLQYMFEQYNISLPSKLPYGLQGTEQTQTVQPTPTP